MKIVLRYEEIEQTIEIDEKDLDDFCISLSVDSDSDTSNKEKLIQKAIDDEFNRPEYNNFHKETRHIGLSKLALRNKDDNEWQDEPSMSEVVDSSLFTKYQDIYEREEEYKELYNKLHTILGTKNNWIEAIMAVRVDGMSVNDYAASIGVKDASIVSKWLTRAERKLRAYYEKTSDFKRLKGSK